MIARGRTLPAGRGTDIHPRPDRAVCNNHERLMCLPGSGNHSDRKVGLSIRAAWLIFGDRNSGIPLGGRAKSARLGASFALFESLV